MIATRLEDSSQVVDGALFPGTAQALLRVYASDGVLSSYDTSSIFGTAPKEPSVVVTSPQDWSNVAPAAPVWLQGQAFDWEEGMLDGESIWWSSDRDGLLGTGDSLLIEAHTLAQGAHEITITAEDGDGLQGQDSVHVFVGQQIFVPMILRS